MNAEDVVKSDDCNRKRLANLSGVTVNLSGVNFSNANLTKANCKDLKRFD